MNHTKKSYLKFSCLIDISNEADLQHQHLHEEIQAYLDSYVGEASVIHWETKRVKEAKN